MRFMVVILKINMFVMGGNFGKCRWSYSEFEEHKCNGKQYI
jgi:hypothetical protein